jgi:hypothetical protein
MAEKKSKTASPPKRFIPLRNAGEKITNDDERPSKSLFDEVKRQIDNEAPVSIPQIPEQLEATTLTTLTTLTSLPSQSSQSVFSVEDSPVSPIKNFQKVPNSITTQAIPQGLFRAGKSKHLYDVLYSLTRGAIIPSRRIRMSKSELMKKSGIGSRITFDTCISHLQQVGLLKVSVFSGQHFGNEFEVFLPDEIATHPSQTSHTGQPSQTTQPSETSSAQNLDRVVSLENSQTRQALIDENKTTSADAKTFLKTEEKRSDDESVIENPAFSIMNEKLESAAKKITGKNTSKYEAEKWGNLAELLILQLEIAASRTTEISSVPAFLTEVLRRKILKPTPQPSAKQSNLKKDLVGKPEDSVETDAEDRQGIKPLDEKGREEALTMISEFADRDEILADFKRWFVEEDWNWLMEKLKK